MDINEIINDQTSSDDDTDNEIDPYSQAMNFMASQMEECQQTPANHSTKPIDSGQISLDNTHLYDTRGGGDPL